MLFAQIFWNNTKHASVPNGRHTLRAWSVGHLQMFRLPELELTWEMPQQTTDYIGVSSRTEDGHGAEAKIRLLKRLRR
jgi:hypothetical protein